MPKAKKFIDKKKSVSFQLVHRSQQDPLVSDDTAPQRVLVPLKEKDKDAEREKRIEEQHKYGIYYNDDTNYLEYLKNSSDTTVAWPEDAEDKIKELKKPKLKLPSIVFASETEDEVGMLNKAMPIAGPQLHLDPELVAAMDEDFDYSDPENQLEDNFMELAEGLASDQEFDENDEDNYISSDFEDEEREDGDEVRSLNGSQFTYGGEETRSRFTNYSMSSSVIRRNDQLTLLDDRFEKVYAGYDDNEVGALDCEEIEGHVPETSDILLQYAKEFEQSQQKELLVKDEILRKYTENESDSESEEEMVKVEINQKKQWDCETILSTYSNLYNRPKVISEPKSNKIRINPRTGVPINVIDANKLTTKALNKLNEENTGGYESSGPKTMGGQSVISQLSKLSVRPKDETPEERLERKKQLKEYKRERRIEKKMNADAFKEEAKRQVKIAINNRNNVQGNRIL